jgi:hypothetical protein
LLNLLIYFTEDDDMKAKQNRSTLSRGQCYKTFFPVIYGFS